MVDKIMFPVARKMVKGWGWSTGTSNFILARVTLSMSFVFLIFWFGYLQYNSITSPIWNGIFFPFWLMSMYVELRWIRKLEQKIKEHEDTGMLPEEYDYFSRSSKFSRNFFIVLGLLQLPLGFMGATGSYFACICLCSFAITDYIILSVDPGGKSILSRIADKVKASLQVLVPAPSGI